MRGPLGEWRDRALPVPCDSCGEYATVKWYEAQKAALVELTEMACPNCGGAYYVLEEDEDGEAEDA